MTPREKQLDAVLRNLIHASDDLTAAVSLAFKHMDNHSVDKLDPLTNKLMDATSAAEKALKAGAP